MAMIQNNLAFMPNEHLTVPKIIIRSWKERLWSWPWKPWEKEKVIQVPDPSIYMINTSMIRQMSNLRSTIIMDKDETIRWRR